MAELPSTPQWYPPLVGTVASVVPESGDKHECSEYACTLSAGEADGPNSSPLNVLSTSPNSCVDEKESVALSFANEEDAVRRTAVSESAPEIEPSRKRNLDELIPTPCKQPRTAETINIMSMIPDEAMSEGPEVEEATGLTSEDPVSSVVEALLDEGDEGEQLEDELDFDFTEAEAVHGSVSDDMQGDEDDDAASLSSSEYLSDDDEEVEMVMERIGEELKSRPGDDPLAVITSFLQKHGLQADQVLPLISESDPPSLTSIVRALIAVMRAKTGHGFLPKREPVATIDTFESVVDLIRRSKKIVVLSGAGVSVSCGIPDFRSPGGLYDTVRYRFGLEEPQLLFDIQYFKKNPRPFFTLAKDIFPGGKVKPSIAHRFVQALEERNMLLRNYTQNIDGLERIAGVERVISCHGSFATATCRRCKVQVPGDSIRDSVLAEAIPTCEICAHWPEKEEEEKPVMKPDIVFFGEPLVDAFFQRVESDLEDADLMIVMGTSLKVAPVSRLPSLLKSNIPRILINREVVGSSSHSFDVELLGNCDAVVQHLMSCLTWSTAPENGQNIPKPYEREGSRRFLFEGAHISRADATNISALSPDSAGE